MPSSTLKDLDKIAWSWVEFTDPKAITHDNIFTAYRIKQNFCQNKACRRNCRGNPFCLSGLGESRLIENLNNPPDVTNTALQKRADGNFVGLKNLGATCYVNSLLQLWFHNKAFRDAIFQWNPLEDPIEQKNDSLYTDGTFVPHTVVGHLQQLFALVYYSKCRYIDPSPLVESLRLDTSTQQDAQEFSKLFISLLESTLKHQSLKNVQNLISDNFRGEYVYVTRCCKCLTESVSPSMFYELDLNVKGHNTLTECLTEFLQEEKLEGADCYSCTVCQTKQEACRFIKLCSLPPVLNLQLLRFVYDREKGQKKKLKTVVQFPETLDMRDFVDTENDEPLLYNLSAVLIHKGTRASSGHFIAYIRDGVTGVWNTFNDESVEKLEGKKLKLDEEDSEVSKKPKVPRLPKGFQSSTDAYMLVYTSEKHKPSLNEVTLSPRLQEYVDLQNKIFDDFCEEIAVSKKQGLDRQEQQLKLYKCLFVNSVDNLKDVDVLPTDWLMFWLDKKSEISREIDNTKLVCPHGRLDPCTVSSAKYVSGFAADFLYDQYGGGPRMKVADVLCEPCVTNNCLIYRTKTKTLEESKEISNLLKKRMGVDEPGYYVDKYCLKTWRTKVLIMCEGKGSGNQTSNGVSSLAYEDASEPMTEESIPAVSDSTTSSKDKVDRITNENKKTKSTMTDRRKLCKYMNTLQRRKKTVTVPLNDIRDCYVLCQRLQVRLNNSSDSSPAKQNSLSAQCKKLRVKLRKLTFPVKNGKILYSPRRNSVVKKNDNENSSVEKVQIVKKKLIFENNSQNSCSMSGEISRSNNDEHLGPSNGENSQQSNGENSQQSNGENSQGDSEKIAVKYEEEEWNRSDDGVESSKAFNEAIMCPHGNLSIDESRRKLVPVRIWEIFKQYFPSAPSFPHDTKPCYQCQNLASKDEVVKQQYYETAINQKKTFSDLLYLRNRPIVGKTEETLYIIHKQYFHQPWSAFLKSSTRRDGGALVEPPASLNVEMLLCIHGLLHFSPVHEEDQARLVLVTRQEWEMLINYYSTDHEATIAPDFTTKPEICESCLAARLDHEQQEKLNYERARLVIRWVTSIPSSEEQEPTEESMPIKKRPRVEESTSPIPPELKKVMKNSVPCPGADVRRSARNRKAPGQKDVFFMVPSSLTLRELKQKITNHWAIAPFDQHICTQDGKELHGDYNTLSSLGILPNSVLLLMVDEPKENFDDMMDDNPLREPEAGFKGTGLVLSY